MRAETRADAAGVINKWQGRPQCPEAAAHDLLLPQGRILRY